MFEGLGLIAIIGAILLVVVFVYVITKNKQSKIPMEKTEQATHDLYEAEHEAAERRDGDA
ncbi:hypothetical protein [Sphingomicrobium flavum]|uniref:hypothetical protein n=1 Tax=Sphingomicrobium flavum TaxID=1229164 RepID=UPI0021AD575A|nr:hypothetical protein [Sphingomicrobium flavum]